MTSTRNPSDPYTHVRVGDEVGEVKREKLDAEREARRRVALAQIRQYGDPVLRMRASDVQSFDGDLQRLVERMTALMQDANGVGLAATQVGVLQRVLVMQPTEGDAFALANPTVAARSDELENDDEGCLSLQGVTVPVERSATITIEGKDEHGEDVSIDFEGLAARVVQHELDHLDGVLFIDHLSRLKRERVTKKFAKAAKREQADADG
ncbi:MAG: peptide deformylase [Microvirga sp.]